MNFQALTLDYWPDVKAIYEQGIATGNATFQMTAPEWEEWDKAHASVCRIILTDGTTVVGWAALTPVSSRAVYSGVAEVSVYITTELQGKGLGKRLLEELVMESEKNNFWTLQASIFQENIASLKIHEHCGFKLLGVRERIGKMNGVWRDTILLQRRSETVGL